MTRVILRVNAVGVGEALQQVAREVQKAYLGARQVRRHRCREPAVALLHFRAQRIATGPGDLKQRAPAVGWIGLPCDQAGCLESRERPGKRLRLHSLGCSKLTRCQRPAPVQMTEQAELQRGEAGRVALKPEPTRQADDAAAKIAGCRLDGLTWRCHNHYGITY